ncbi:MAG TPA: hypothetical protein VGO13_04265 [Solirubrobacterales bacterium]|nr:hypothetical protein [Solirubrobacterales bacterium]
MHLVGERWVDRYGPMVRVKLPGSTMVLVADLEAINEILRDRPDGYRRWVSQREVIEEMGPNGVFSSEGDALPRLRAGARRLCRPGFRSPSSWRWSQRACG